MNDDEGLKGLHFKDAITGRPPCDFCQNPAHVSLNLFRGLVAAETLNACHTCMDKSRKLGDKLSRCSRLRITSYATGQHTTGAPSQVRALLETLKPQQGFKTITSAIRITTGRNWSRLLVCAACQESISPEAPGFVRWATNEEGKFHSIRLFHRECCTDPGHTQGAHHWADLESLEELDRSNFTVTTAELLDQIAKKWQMLTEYSTEG